MKNFIYACRAAKRFRCKLHFCTQPTYCYWFATDYTVKQQLVFDFDYKIIT